MSHRASLLNADKDFGSPHVHNAPELKSLIGMHLFGCIHPGQHDLVALNLLNKSSLQQRHTYTQGQQTLSLRDQESSSPSTAAPPLLRSQKGQTHTIHASRYPKAVSLLLFTPTDRLPGSIKSTACGEVAFAYRPTRLSTSSSGTDNKNLSLM